MAEAIDVPICFIKTKSLKTSAINFKPLKLLNLLMRAGLRNKMSGVFFQALRAVALGRAFKKLDLARARRYAQFYIFAARLLRGPAAYAPFTRSP